MMAASSETSPKPPIRQPRVPPRSVAADERALQAQLDQLENQFINLRDQLRRAQRLASIGTMSAMLAHEFNNLFTPVMAYARAALDADDASLMKTALEKTLKHTEIMRQMADRLVGMVKNGETGTTRCRVATLVDDAIGCLGRDLAKDNIAVNIQIDAALEVRVNPHQIQQVLFNLILNARQAMLGQRGRLTVDAAPTNDGMVAVSVRDTGVGIPPENLECIFEPFFSTKQYASRLDEGGLGLGLAICRELAAEHGGSLTVQSQPGVGTSFTLTIPRAE
jgi:signal transduction histidine kinase